MPSSTNQIKHKKHTLSTILNFSYKIFQNQSRDKGQENGHYIQDHCHTPIAKTIGINNCRHQASVLRILLQLLIPFLLKVGIQMFRFHSD